MFKFDFNKEYVFSYLVYEVDTKQKNKKYHKLSGKIIDIVSEDLELHDFVKATADKLREENLGIMDILKYRA